MPQTRFPKENGVWKQVNLGSRFGDLQKTFNANLVDEQGKIKISPRLLVNTSSSDDAELDVAPFAAVFNPTLDKWHVGAGDSLFVGGDAPNEAFTESTATSAPTFETTSRPDLAVFAASNGDYYTFGMAAELFRLALDGTSWGAALTSLGTSLNGAPLIPFKNRLYFRKGKAEMASINQALSAVATATAQYALALNDNTRQISCGKASAEYIYLGTIAEYGQKAYVVEWNGSSTSATRIIPVDAQGVLAIEIWDGIPWLFDSNGVVRFLNGSSFVEADRLPFKSYKALRPITSANHTQYLCHYNGMVADRDRLLLNLNTSYADGTTEDNAPSGLWIYTRLNGLHHHSSPTNTKSGDSIYDYGSQKVSKIGALAIAKSTDSDSNGSILAGLTIFTDASTEKSAIFYNDTNQTLQSAGSIILSRISSIGLRDKFQRFYTKLRRLLNATDKIVAKFRVTEAEPTEATITYVDTNSLTVPTASFTTAPVVGDEIEILCGVGAGRCVHISSITTNGSNYEIDVDTTITGATTQTAKARFSNWKKIAEFTSQSDDVANFPIDAEMSSSLDIKLWILSTGKNEIFEFLISHQPNQLPE